MMRAHSERLLATFRSFPAFTNSIYTSRRAHA
jgi:hypothetical protein